MTLEQWCSNGWLVEHKTSPSEISNGFAVVDRDLGDAHVPGLSPEARHNLAYNAARQLAALALAACGYRPQRGKEHCQAIDSLALTVKPERGVIDVLHAARHKRSKSVYDLAGAISHTEADELLALAAELREKTMGWFKSNHAGLLR